MDASAVMTAPAPPAPLAPTAKSERIQLIDMLRGFAIFGILMVNMHYFAYPFQAPHITPDSTPLDRTIYWIIGAFFNTKFFSLFSFLFGLGMSIQMGRAEQAGVRFGPLYARRLFILLLFGLAHGVLLWVGDILFVYAALGFLLLLFWRNAKPRTLVVWACILLGVMLIIYGLGAGSMALGRMTPESSQMIDQIVAETQVKADADLAHDMQVYGTGSYAEVTGERLKDFVQAVAEYNIWIAPSILAMFLLGLHFGKRKLLQNADENLPFFRKLLLFVLPVGLVTNIAWATLEVDIIAAGSSMDPTFLYGMMLLAVGGPTLSLSYVCLAVLITRSQRVARLLSPLAPVGQMALTNYLTHSIVMTTLFYGYGFRLLGSVGLSMTILIGIGLYALQIPFSAWWMSRFRFGPFEWVWRSLTYWRPQPMRNRQAGQRQVA